MTGRTDLAAFFELAGPVAVLVDDPEESLMAALPVLLSLDARDREAYLVPPSLEGRWARHVRDWLDELDRPIGLSLDALDDAGSVIVAGHASLLERERFDRPSVPTVAALLGLGAEAALGADPAASEAALSRVAADGGVLGVEPILRFGPVGRQLIELVEHVHHLAGPTDQSVLADSLRAALFGRVGCVPVSLTTRESPPRLGPLTTLIWYLELGEIAPPE